MNDQCTDDSHRDREFTAQERRATDHHSQDRVQLQPEPGIVGVGAANIGRDHDAGNRGAQSRQRIDQHQQHPAPNTGERGCGPVDPDRLNEQANRSAPHEKSDEDHQDQRDHRCHGKAQERAGTDKDQGGVVEGNNRALGDKLGDAPASNHQHQRRNNGLDVEHSHEKAVPESAGQPDGQCGDDRDRCRIAGHHHGCGHCAAHRHDCADRKIDAFGRDHAGHANGQNGHRGAAIDDVDSAAE